MSHYDQLIQAGVVAREKGDFKTAEIEFRNAENLADAANDLSRHSMALGHWGIWG